MADDIRRREIAVINPTPKMIVTYKGQEFPVLSISDLPYRRMLVMLNPEVPKDETLEQTIERIKSQICEVCPTVPPALLEEMTYNELLAFLGAATEADTPANPIVAPVGSGESSTTSPPPPAPSDGVTPS